MSRAKPKYFIASTYTNRIGYRKLTPFEERNPGLFEHCHKAFETWEDAHAWVLETRTANVARAKKNLAAAERQLANAKTMTKPADSTETMKEKEAA